METKKEIKLLKKCKKTAKKIGDAWTVYYCLNRIATIKRGKQWN